MQNQAIYRIVRIASDLTPLKGNGSLLTDNIIFDALIIMGIGFASVFVVLTIIYFLVQLLNRAFPKEVESEE